MAFKFKNISDTEFRVNNHTVTMDSNGNWIANPPVEGYQLRLAIVKHINALNNGNS